jgi:histidinol dehydrogenase
MPHELDKILISFDQPQFQEKLDNVFLSKAGMSHFGMGPRHKENRQKVEAILRDVVEIGDEAVVKHTKKFDYVELTPEQFRINQEDLKKTHEQISKRSFHRK